MARLFSLLALEYIGGIAWGLICGRSVIGRRVGWWLAAWCTRRRYWLYGPVGWMIARLGDGWLLVLVALILCKWYILEVV
jgi:hypothetical protein